MKQKILDELDIEKYQYFKVNEDSDENILHIIQNDRNGSSFFKTSELMSIREIFIKYQDKYDITISINEAMIKF